jgi:putative transposase
MRNAEGAPRELMTCSKVEQTRSLVKERSTSMATDSRVNSSMTHKIRSFPPESVPSSMKSKHHGHARVTIPDSDDPPRPNEAALLLVGAFGSVALARSARGMTTREIQGHLHEIYGIEVSPSLISTVTDAVLEEVREWQNRPLDAIYPILYLDALHVKVKSHGRVVSKAIYLAFGVNLSGRKEVLGLWAAETEGAKFWLQVITEIKNRGVQDIYIVCVDGLRGFAEAIEAVFPKTQVQLCLVHLVRHSLNYVSYKDRKGVASDLKAIYQAATLPEAEGQLAGFEEKWRPLYPLIARSWRANWAKVAPMFGYPSQVRRAIYTTNTIESLNMTLRKISKNRALFPSDEAVFKLLYLALKNISQRWTMPIAHWSSAMNQFAILFDGRVPMGGLEINLLTQND